MDISELRKIEDLTDNLIGSLAKAESEYKFQKELTKKLDSHKEDFTEMTLLEIVLWKTNRYPSVGTEIIEKINFLRKNYSEDGARSLLGELLTLRGFDLPMASTVLRFACPNELQIIDQRVYRLILPGSLKIPYNKEAKIKLYFEYLIRLREVCNKHQIPFEKSDRILYQLDKIKNKGVLIKY